MRNQWNALEFYPQFVTELKREASSIGVFREGIESDKKHRGSSINVDVYGYDESQLLAIIQVRQCVFRPGRFNRVRKDYYLIGHTELGNIFAHPVDTPARSRRALSSPENTVKYVLAKIWGCKEEELTEIVRQGDIAFIPARLPKEAIKLETKEIILRDTHKVTAKDIYQLGDIYYVAKEAKVEHTKHQHSIVKVKNGFYRVVAGYRAQVYGFSSPIGD